MFLRYPTYLLKRPTFLILLVLPKPGNVLFRCAWILSIVNELFSAKTAAA